MRAPLRSFARHPLLRNAACSHHSTHPRLHLALFLPSRLQVLEPQRADGLNSDGDWAPVETLLAVRAPQPLLPDAFSSASLHTHRHFIRPCLHHCALPRRARSAAIRRYLGNNMHTGVIPTEVGQLTALSTLYVDHCCAAAGHPLVHGAAHSLRSLLHLSPLPSLHICHFCAHALARGDNAGRCRATSSQDRYPPKWG